MKGATIGKPGKSTSLPKFVSITRFCQLCCNSRKQALIHTEWNSEFWITSLHNAIQSLQKLCTLQFMVPSFWQIQLNVMAYLYRIRRPFLATPIPKDQGVILKVYFSRNSVTSTKGKGAISTRVWKASNKMCNYAKCGSTNCGVFKRRIQN